MVAASQTDELFGKYILNSWKVRRNTVMMKMKVMNIQYREFFIYKYADK